MSDAAAIAAPAVEQPAAPAAAPAVAQPATTTPATSSWVDAPSETTPATDGAQAAEPAKDAAPADPAGNAAAAEGAKTEDKPAERVAPEAYEFKAPEGVALDRELTAEFEGLARELSMPQGEAQALVERMAPKIQERVQAAQLETLAQARAEWSAQVDADAELGGVNKAAVLQNAGRALTNFGSEPLRALLKDSGIQDHPEVIRFFHRVGRSLSEDTFLRGKAPTKSSAQAIYAASQMNP